MGWCLDAAKLRWSLVYMYVVVAGHSCFLGLMTYGL